jgi:hypothetical protein
MNAGAGDDVCKLNAHFDSHFNREDVVSIITPQRRPPTSRNGIVTGCDVPLLRTTREQRRPHAESPISQTLSRGPRHYCHTPVDSRGVPAIQVV